MAVTGEVRFKETEVTYQSRFMDISKDSDIIIISKEDKKKKEEDNFLKNTFLNIKIVSDDVLLYKVDEGEIEMKPDILIRKEFGEAQRITGKIKRSKQKLIEAWIEIHQEDLIANWELAINGNEVFKIDPLR
jgi:hypothetical protein